MVKIQFFTKENYSEMSKWFRAHGLPSPDYSYLPANGYFVPGVAAGFVYLTDSPISILDCFVSNPHAEIKERDAALDWIVIHLTDLAQKNGTKLIICNTQIPAVCDRAEKLGFFKTGKNHSFAKELS